MSQQGLIELTWYNEDNEEVTHSFPAHNIVCERCEGFGTHLTPSIGEHAYSSEEFYEAFSEPEDREQYFSRGGIYDVQCETCHGKNVVAVVDEDKLNDDQKKMYLEYCDHERVRAEWDHEDRQTFRMENGGYD